MKKILLGLILLLPVLPAAAQNWPLTPERTVRQFPAPPVIPVWDDAAPQAQAAQNMSAFDQYYYPGPAGFRGDLGTSPSIAQTWQWGPPAYRYNKPVRVGFYRDPFFYVGGFATRPDGKDGYSLDHGNPQTYNWQKMWVQGTPNCRLDSRSGC